MRLDIDRRAFLAAAGAGLMLPARPALAGLWPATGFTHGVASFAPGATGFTLWTRYASADGKGNELQYEVATDPGFTNVRRRDTTTAGVDTWGVARAEVSGLPPGAWYYYRFTAPDGTKSPVGRTRTLPVGPLARFNVAVFSCANKPFGWFNAYAHAAARTDIDLVIHTGDYIYEYPRGEYPSAAQALAGRDIEPAGEILRLDDYRQRYASYRVDPGLQELHRLFPMIALWDDHEIANDTWKGGAQNHQPEEGDYKERYSAAITAHLEWLPGPTPQFQYYNIGDLVTLVTLDTRTWGREKQLDLAGAIKGGNEALLRFRDQEWNNPLRTLLGVDQELWLRDTLTASVKAGQKWQLLAQQVVMGNLVVPQTAMQWLSPDAPPRLRNFLAGGMMAAAAGMPGNMDSWGGYPKARGKLLKLAQSTGADMVVVSGDSHNAWAFNLAEGGLPAGVEFAGHSVTSPGYESALAADPALVRDGLVAGNPELAWCDTSRRGYLTVSFTPEAARADWVFMQTVRERSLATGPGQAAVVKRGTRKLTLV